MTGSFRVLNIDYNDAYNEPESTIFRDLTYNLSTTVSDICNGHHVVSLAYMYTVARVNVRT